MKVTVFCENSKVVSSDFSMMKNIVASSSSGLQNFAILNKGFLIQFVSLNLLQLVHSASKSIHNQINYQLCNH